MTPFSVTVTRSMVPSRLLVTNDDGNGVAAEVSDTKVFGPVEREIASLMMMGTDWVRLVWPKADAAVKKDAAPPVAQRNILRALLVLKFIGLTMFSSLNS